MIEDNEFSYALYAVTGLMSWQAIVFGITAPQDVTNLNADVISTKNISALTLIFRTYFELLFGHLIRMLIASTAILYFGFSIGAVIGYCVFTTILLFLSGGIGFFMAPFSFITTDIRKFTTLILRPLMFVSGVIFPVNIELFKILNPLLYIMEILREQILTPFKIGGAELTFFFITLVIFYAGTKAYRKSFKIICEYI